MLKSSALFKKNTKFISELIENSKSNRKHLKSMHALKLAFFTLNLSH